MVTMTFLIGGTFLRIIGSVVLKLYMISEQYLGRFKYFIVKKSVKFLCEENKQLFTCDSCSLF